LSAATFGNEGMETNKAQDEAKMTKGKFKWEGTNKK
jgi:hypothetical protein